jgi:K+/H+ antiporter YhaU regulatory subunit KhtT
MLTAATIPVLVAAMDAVDVVWSVVAILCSLLIAAAAFIIRTLYTQAKETRAENAKLKDQGAADRHASVMAGMATLSNDAKEIKTETRGLRTEVHGLADRVVKVEKRMDGFEAWIKPEGRN